jgi:hypothetical protein
MPAAQPATNFVTPVVESPRVDSRMTHEKAVVSARMPKPMISSRRVRSRYHCWTDEMQAERARLEMNNPQNLTIEF